jgi:HD-GYP domain-containing protein (c-di-GMP phosphodiesterase class II)
MITIVDVFAAMIERRAYKPRMPARVGYQTLVDMGPRLDEDLVRALKLVAHGF